MFSNFIRILLIISMLVFILWGFSDSYSASNIDNIAHITAMAIDKNDDLSNNLKVSFQIVNVPGSSGESALSDSNVFITSVNSNTITNAINIFNTYIGKQVNFSHCKIIVFSKELALHGISPEIYTLMNNVQIRPSTNIVISTSDAKTYLQNSNPNVEELITRYYDTFELTSNFTGYSEDTTLGRFYNKLIAGNSSNTAILGSTLLSSKSSSSNNKLSDNSKSSGESSSIESNNDSSKSSSDSDSSSSKESSSSSNASPKRGTQNIGIAIFKEDKFVGQLTELESISHLLVTNNIDSCIVSIPVQSYHQNVLDFKISQYKRTKISLDTSSDVPHISLILFCSADVLSIDKEKDFGNIGFINNISPIVKSFLEDNISSYLNKITKEFNADVADFGSLSRSNFWTLKDWKNYDWESKYQNATFSVNVNLNLNSNLLFIDN